MTIHPVGETAFNKTCCVSGETRVNGACQCGNSCSCKGISTGSYCDAANSQCKCSATKDSCKVTEDCVNGECVRKYFFIILQNICTSVHDKNIFKLKN